MSALTDEQIDELFERSKDDRAIIVGSEVRQLIGDIRRLKELIGDIRRLKAEDGPLLCKHGNEHGYCYECIHQQQAQPRPPRGTFEAAYEATFTQVARDKNDRIEEETLEAGHHYGIYGTFDLELMFDAGWKAALAQQAQPEPTTCVACPTCHRLVPVRDAAWLNQQAQSE